ncbi:sensor histidine kinase N-terminal domain-containing protein [Pseudomonas fulva]|uniref:ATP-binding protein n=1 Tax=Pseudomonas fulva TaxID=47880 RepID=UPI00201D65DD|nr:ATP-binding protein [Pseudomonas fulva]UQY33973.1 sensor histidine kinase N-terminal domain-containing protein [Pseudomonas fulva]
MSIRSGLVLRLGVSFVLLWALAATWMLRDLQVNIDRSLDERLEASARLVVSLLSLPAFSPVGQEPEPSKSFSMKDVASMAGMACQVSSLKGEILVKSRNSPDEKMGDLGVGHHTQVADGTRWRTFTLEVNGVRVSTADRIEQRSQLKYSILKAAAVPVVVALIGGLLVLWIGVGQGLRPLTRITNALFSRNAQCLDPLDVSELPRELRPLAMSQNELLSRISHAIERERRFTGDAAHELRSPLTAVKTHIQVAQLTEGEASQTALVRAQQGADRLQRILEQLLLLARVEGSLSFDDGTQALPTDVARQALDDSEQDSGIRIQLQKNLDVYPIAVPSVLATAALRNLLDNALRHTAAGTKVDLLVSIEEGMASFCVRDRGPGIPEENLAEVAKRFWHNGNQSGSGLGLAIVDAIVVRFRGELSFRNTGDGLEVLMKLPLLK